MPLIICLLLFGCKKNPFDYRSKFIGNYIFSAHITTFNVYGPGIYTDTTYSYNGNVASSSYNDCVKVYFSENIFVEPIIYEDGTLEGKSYYQYFVGEFESTKKIKFTYFEGGLGGGTTYYISGEKNK